MGSIGENAFTREGEFVKFLQCKSHVTVGTHPGMVHADECFAIACIYLLGELWGFSVRVIRTSDPKELASCDLRVDTGKKDNPDTGDFDHHQEKKPIRENGVLYSSFGLVWAAIGTILCKGIESAAAAIEKSMVMYIDYRDTGGNLDKLDREQKLPQTVRTYGISDAFRALNPAWDAHQDFNRSFAEALTLARVILSSEIARAVANTKAGPFLDRMVQRNVGEGKPQYLVLDMACPTGKVRQKAPWVVFIIHPYTEGGWLVNAMQKSGSKPSEREYQQLFPETWRGKDPSELATITGVPDAVFCHAAGYIARADSLEGAITLAKLALA